MNADELTVWLKVARGDAFADLVLRNANMVNVYTREVIHTDIAITDGRIAGLGTGYNGATKIDLHDAYVIPGLIDSHVHIESSMCTPASFADAVIAHGVTTVVTDPHEIANVAGVAGIEYMLKASEDLPVTVYVNLPSCVPATHMGSAGATLSASDLLPLLGHERVLGLAEYMNVPGAVLGLPDSVEKLTAFSHTHIDGHAPGQTGKWLQAYIGSGPSTDHESTTAAEALEKVRNGMYVLVREATGAKNLKAIVPIITPENARRFAFATDDRHPDDLLNQGTIDHSIRLAIAQGLDPLIAIQMATLNAAEAFGLRDRGAISPGKRADLVIFDTLSDFKVKQVYSGGALVVDSGMLIKPVKSPSQTESHILDSIHVDSSTLSFHIPAQGASIRVIGMIENELLTEERILPTKIVNNMAVSDIERDILKLAVVERHHNTGNVGLGFVQGLGLKRGAIAGSVGHDCHNLTIAGTNDSDMLAAVEAIKALGGGLVAVLDGEVLAQVALPIAGLMSDQPMTTVQDEMHDLLKATATLGSALHDPFMILGFLALEVIPKLKLTDMGLVDVEKFDFVPLWVEQ